MKPQAKGLQVLVESARLHLQHLWSTKWSNGNKTLITAGTGCWNAGSWDYTSRTTTTIASAISIGSWNGAREGTRVKRMAGGVNENWLVIASKGIVTTEKRIITTMMLFCPFFVKIFEVWLQCPSNVQAFLVFLLAVPNNICLSLLDALNDSYPWLAKVKSPQPCKTAHQLSFNQYTIDRDGRNVKIELIRCPDGRAIFAFARGRDRNCKRNLQIDYKSTRLLTLWLSQIYWNTLQVKN